MALRQPANMQKAGSLLRIRQDGAAPNVASPKGISVKTPAKAAAGDDHTLGLQRRRLSVVSTNKLVDGMAAASLDDDSSAQAQALAAGAGAVVAFAGLSKKGYAPYNPRKKNQDAMVIQFDAATQSLLLCVFDGHGEAGDGVSGAIRDRYASELFSHAKFARSGDLERDAESIQTAIAASLRAVEQLVLRDPSIDTEFSGTTAVVVVVRDNLVVVGNVGDSRITRGFAQGAGVSAQELSVDHKPDRPDEKARILASGGRVFAVEYDDGIDGPPRVWLGHMDVPGLAMSRSLGDAVAHTAGVLSEPEFTMRWLDDKDRCLIVATDGLWEFMSNEECVDMALAQQDPKLAVDQLIMEANRRWMKEEQVIDDTTVIVAYLDASEQGKSKAKA